MLDSSMANLQVKNISEDLHQRLRDTAAEDHTTISELVRVAIERELTRREWQSTFNTHPPTELHVTASELLREEREQREE